MRVQTAIAAAMLVIGCGGGEIDPVDGGARDTDAGEAGALDASATDAGAERTAVLYVGQDDGELVAHALGPDGTPTETSRTRTGDFPAFAALSPDGRSMYVVNEAAGEVVALAIDPGTGRTAVRNVRSSGGAGPTHVSIDPSGSFVSIANYGAGSVAVFPIEADGSLAPASDAESPGANAHAIVIDPTGRWALVPCLGDDLVAVLAFDAAAGTLEPHGSHRTARGAGPRHLAFGAGDRAYLVNELDSTIDVLAFDAGAGTLSALQTISTLPAGFSGANSTAEILVHPGGRFVYASNRGHDSIAVFEIGSGGMLTARGHAMLGARTPRSMSITPDGARLYAGALDDDRIVRFAIAADGSLGREGETAIGAGPFFVGVFLIPP